MVRPTIAEVLKRFWAITGESKKSDAALNGFSTPWINTGNRSSIISRTSSLTAVSCE